MAWRPKRDGTCPRLVRVAGPNMSSRNRRPVGEPSANRRRDAVEGIPEHVTPLPERGEGRNHDLLLYGRGAHGGVVVSVEAKVDEPFGETIGAYFDQARASAVPTRVPDRIDALLTMVFGNTARPDTDPWRALRYQLLTAVAGTAIEASHRDVATAVVIVHEFLTANMDDRSVKVNADDFRAFVGVLCAVSASEVTEGRLYGPAVLAQGAHLQRRVDLLIGKAVFDWSAKDEDLGQRTAAKP